MPAEYETLILRFRDLVTEDNETIQKHKEIIDSCESVWWAWWKKGNEVTPADEFAALGAKARERPLTIFLVDSGQGKVYKATCVDIIRTTDEKKGSPDKAKTPEYYREQQYYAWFEFTGIEDGTEDELKEYSYVNIKSLFKNEEADYNKFNDKKVYSVHELVQQNRTVWFVRKSKGSDLDNEIVLLNAELVQPSDFREKYHQISGNTLLWLSDLHLADHKFTIKGNSTTKTLAQHLQCCVENFNNIGALLISGDITSCAKRDGFDEAKLLIQDLNRNREFPLNSENIVICPGNHDFEIKNDVLDRTSVPEYVSENEDSIRCFSEFYHSIYNLKPNKFITSGRKLLLPSGCALEIAALNSLILQQYSNFEGHGFISQEQLDFVADKMGWTKNKDSSSIRIVMMHHHYLPTCLNETIDVTRASSVVYDADRLMQWLIKYNVRFLLHGHKHKSFVSQLAYPAESSNGNINIENMQKVTVVGMGGTGAKGSDNKFATVSFDNQKVIFKFYRIYSDESTEDGICQTITIPM